MTKIRYNKTPLTFEDQVELLKCRGLDIEDEKKAITYLKEISYFRLSAYFLPYQNTKDKFNNGTTFQQIIHTYTFDRELRLLIFDCIERIEIAIRTQVIYSMAHHYNDSHWQDEKSLFIRPYYNKVGYLVDPYSEFQSIISKAKTARTQELFIKHYLNKYSTPSNPPSWMCLELLTIGELSRLFKGLLRNQDKKRIADFFDVHHRVFISWLHSLTYVRNICAHHSRLWNRDLAVEPDRLLKPVGPWISKPFENNKRVFYFINILKYLLIRSNPGNRLKDRLITLFEKYQNIPIKYLGIPSDGQGNLLNWENEPMWK